MQTLKFVRGLNAIVQGVKANEIRVAIAPVISRQNQALPEHLKAQFSELIFGARTACQNLAADPDIAKIVVSMKINDALSADRLGKLLAIYRQYPNTGNMAGNPEFLSEFQSLDALLEWLIAIQRATAELLEADKTAGIPASDRILELEIVDYDDSGIDASRILEIISTLLDLHERLALLLAERDSRLKVRWTDSGSHLVLGLQASEKIIDAIKSLFVDIWDRFRSRQFEKFDRRVDSLSKGLTFLDKLNEAIEKNTIQAQDADTFKQMIITDMTKLFEHGTMLASVPAEEGVDHRRLLAERRGTKLLSAGDPPSPNNPDNQ